MSAGRGQRDAVGLIVLAVGAGILALGAGTWPDALRGLNAPIWVLLAAGGVFALAGASLLSHGRTPPWVPAVIGICILTLFAVIPAWIAWGGSRRGFSVAGGVGGVSLALGFDLADIGRLVFAGSALLTGLIAVVVWIAWLRKLSWPGRAWFAAAVTLAAYTLLVAMPAEPRWADVADDHQRLARYALLTEDEGWARVDGAGVRRWNFPPWRNFEDWTKSARSRLAAARKAPAGQEVLDIPYLATPPQLDGSIGADEWRGARRIELAPQALGTVVHVAGDARYLYFAADVPADTTSEGFDQFRVWFHIGLSPWLDNERAFVGRAGEVSSLRAMRFPWGDHAPRSRTHWHIYERARGASSVSGHRRFELALDLDEAGIAPGVAFPLWLEVEGDPQRDAAGKFKARTDLGRAGSHQAPLWLRLAPR
jgi:hypothetical protein